MKKLLYDIIDYVRRLRYDYGLQASFDFSDIPAEHKEILLPYSEDYVLEILPEEQFLRVDIPEDIFDLY